MGIVVHRRLAIPLWAVAFFTIALTAPRPAAQVLMPPATLFVMAVVGIAVIIFAMRGTVPLAASRSAVRAVPGRHRPEATVAITMATGICVRSLDERNQSAADDALELVRMDDDGGWQMPRPLAKPRSGAAATERLGGTL